MKKYPGNYFKSYIYSFDTSECTPDREGLTQLAKLFIELQGIDEFVCVVNEIKEIKDNDDWGYFVKTAAENKIDTDEETLKEMASTAVQVLDDYRKHEHREYSETRQTTENLYKQNQDYINEFVEWQEHQYVPGYYTGGKIPPFVTKPGRPGMMGIIMVITGSFTILMFLVAFIIGLCTQNIFQGLASSLALAGVGLAQIFAGLRYIKRQREADKKISD